MKKISMSVALSAVLAMSTLALTETKAVAGTGYGTAGCGLGAVLLGDQAGFMQVFAATLNGTSGNQTFGMTFGTLNCGNPATGLAGTASFIQTNREVVAKDISRGSGETLTTLATLGGCADSTNVGASLQRNFEVIFPSNAVSDVQVSENVITVLQNDKSLACNALI